MPDKTITYKDAGVHIDTANVLIGKIKTLVKRTHRSEVLSSIGHYAGLFELGRKKYKNPVLVASTDGVGTKLKLALDWNNLTGLGQDLVAMSANDILCMGATPLFFLDYLATGKIDLTQSTILLQGITEACRDLHCALLGGETAEMPVLYQSGDFDLAGFMVGVVEKNEIIDGSKIKVGDHIIGLASNGPHSNGFSLIRKIVALNNLQPDSLYTPLEKPLADLLLEPTRLYVNTILKLKSAFDLHGIAHITGGGLIENLPRLFPARCGAIIDRRAWKRPTLFQKIQEWGNISEDEMQRVFNCGIGLMLVVPAGQSEKILKRLHTLREKAWVIGEIVPRKKTAEPLQIL